MNYQKKKKKWLQAQFQHCFNIPQDDSFAVAGNLALDKNIFTE